MQDIKSLPLRKNIPYSFVHIQNPPGTVLAETVTVVIPQPVRLNLIPIVCLKESFFCQKCQDGFQIGLVNPELVKPWLIVHRIRLLLDGLPQELGCLPLVLLLESCSGLCNSNPESWMKRGGCAKGSKRYHG